MSKPLKKHDLVFGEAAFIDIVSGIRRGHPIFDLNNGTPGKPELPGNTDAPGFELSSAFA
jgi:hypothetical protein